MEPRRRSGQAQCWRRELEGWRRRSCAPVGPFRLRPTARREAEALLGLERRLQFLVLAVLYGAALEVDRGVGRSVGKQLADIVGGQHVVFSTYMSEHSRKKGLSRRPLGPRPNTVVGSLRMPRHGDSEGRG